MYGVNIVLNTNNGPTYSQPLGSHAVPSCWVGTLPTFGQIPLALKSQKKSTYGVQNTESKNVSTEQFERNCGSVIHLTSPQWLVSSRTVIRGERGGIVFPCRRSTPNGQQMGLGSVGEFLTSSADSPKSSRRSQKSKKKIHIIQSSAQRVYFTSTVCILP